jgi:nitronate monooxygenase
MAMALRTKLTEKLGVRHPVLLAPMGNISDGALAAAVSAAGGFGLIGGGLSDQPAEWYDRQFAAAGNQRVGCGFITWAMARRPEALDFALSHSPTAIMLSFGDAAPFIPQIKARGALAICQVHSLAHARAVLAEGADIIVAQGSEAGGHGATRRATFPLVPAVADMIAASSRGVLLVAAGGIADGRGLAAALMLGADGVLMGSRFYASEEAVAPAMAKSRIVASGGDDTIRTSVFDLARAWDFPDGTNTARALRNRFTDAWHGREAELLAASEREFPRFFEAAASGDYEIAHVFTGEAIDLIHAVEPAGAIVERVVHEAEAALARRFA